MNILKKSIIILAVFYAGYIMFAAVYYFGTDRSSAQMSPPTAGCPLGIKNITYGEKCGARQPNSYRKAEFRCYDGSRGEFRSRYCLDQSAFKQAAFDSCNSIAKCLLLPTSTPTPTLSPTPYCIPYPSCPPSVPNCIPQMAVPTGVRLCPRPSPTPTIIVVDDCAWCGSDCVDGPLEPGQICNQALPPTGYVCKRVAGVCQAIRPTVTPLPCSSPPACGGELIIGDPAPGTVCPRYSCLYTDTSPIPN